MKTHAKDFLIVFGAAPPADHKNLVFSDFGQADLPYIGATPLHYVMGVGECDAKTVEFVLCQFCIPSLRGLQSDQVQRVRLNPQWSWPERALPGCRPCMRAPKNECKPE